MIFSMIFLFLVLMCSAAVIYYLYAFFIPALKLKKKEYNNLLVSNFNLDDDFDKDSVYNVLLPEEQKNDILFDSIYRSKVNNEKICVKFDGNSAQENNIDDEKSEFQEDFSSDNKNLGKNALLGSKLFKFWIYCYKLFYTKRSKAK